VDPYRRAAGHGTVRARERAGGRSVRAFPYLYAPGAPMSRRSHRTTADLVAELHLTAEHHDRAALVVGFDDRTEFVWASDPDPLDSLNTHVRSGGDPLGLVTGHSQGLSSVSVRATPLLEYEGTEWVEKYLIQVLAAVRRSAADSGIQSGPITG
jgi:hypothetical protein